MIESRFTIGGSTANSKISTSLRNRSALTKLTPQVMAIKQDSIKALAFEKAPLWPEKAGRWARRRSYVFKAAVDGEH